ncbi:MAG: hypothetical protein V7L00_11740 [Nostoc sp.]|uniref:hypothetical protein n=1 Tax=unclassified Nostoc TaxID=2593658 RepID=UPI0025D65386|nr:hypothetical protein [Nostoc sp. JL33]MBN3869075.1 hypothetical protein [Nostoc sp. JL33]
MSSLFRHESRSLRIILAVIQDKNGRLDSRPVVLGTSGGTLLVPQGVIRNSYLVARSQHRH